MDKSSLRAHRSLRRDDWDAVEQTENYRRSAVDRVGGRDAGQSGRVIKVREQLAREKETQIGTVVVLTDHGDKMRGQLKLC